MQTPQDRLRNEAQDAVRALLKDPDSAQFREGPLTNLHLEAGLLCNGEVNSKNSFGGYIGFQEYFYSRTEGAVLEESGLEEWKPISDACIAEMERKTAVLNESLKAS
jgi:hypothetical protein